MGEHRFPRSVFGSGDEPDPRFTLANERTCLAWIRTSLAFSTAGVALEALSLPIHPGLRTGCALLLIGIGVVATVQAWSGWARTERALRRRQPLPGPVSTPVVVMGATLAGAMIAAGIVFR